MEGAQAREQPPPPAPVRLPGAEHERIQELEAGVEAQQTALQEMQASIAKQETAAADLDRKRDASIGPTQTAATELRQQNAAIGATIASNQASRSQASPRF